jgi:hypothetical protein
MLATVECRVIAKYTLKNTTMITLTQQEGETRKNFLLRLAMTYIKDHTGYMGMDDMLFYDEAECDGYCLADDIEIEFDVQLYDEDGL